MRLRYFLDETNKRVYTFKYTDPKGEKTYLAHPARFSPDDQFSEYRIECKRRFGLLPTQKPASVH